MRLLSCAEAASLVPSGATVAVSGGGYRVVPEAMLEALEARFMAEGTPKALTVFSPSMVERSRGGQGGGNTGLHRLSHEGMLHKVILGSFSRVSGAALMTLVNDEQVAAYNLPMGTAYKLLQAIASGQPGFVTTVGLRTFVDPRFGGGRMNARAQGALSRVVAIGDDELLYYRSFPVDVALIKGTTADERGNIFLEREAYSHGVLHTAMAAKNSGGLVIAQVNRLAQMGSIHPRMGRVPGGLVDVVVVSEDTFEDEQDPVLNGEIRGVLSPSQGGDVLRRVIARRVVDELSAGQVVNLGAGLPMYDIPNMALEVGRHREIYFSVEQGPFGGLPRVGGVSRNPEVILDSLETFDYYEGGGPDVACLAFGQVDSAGNVNVSKFGGITPGCGGFVNIIHKVKRLIFCGTMTAGGLHAHAENGRLKIEREGRVMKFIEDVEQVTFSGPEGLRKGQAVSFVTERAVFELTSEGLLLTEIAPGLTPEVDVVPVCRAAFRVSPSLRPMEARLFGGE